MAGFVGRGSSRAIILYTISCTCTSFGAPMASGWYASGASPPASLQTVVAPTVKNASLSHVRSTSSGVRVSAGSGVDVSVGVSGVG